MRRTVQNGFSKWYAIRLFRKILERKKNRLLIFSEMLSEHIIYIKHYIISVAYLFLLYNKICDDGSVVDQAGLSWVENSFENDFCPQCYPSIQPSIARERFHFKVFRIPTNHSLVWWVNVSHVAIIISYHKLLFKSFKLFVCLFIYLLYFFVFCAQPPPDFVPRSGLSFHFITW